MHPFDHLVLHSSGVLQSPVGRSWIVFTLESYDSKLTHVVPTPEVSGRDNNDRRRGGAIGDSGVPKLHEFIMAYSVQYLPARLR